LFRSHPWPHDPAKGWPHHPANRHPCLHVIRPWDRFSLRPTKSFLHGKESLGRGQESSMHWQASLGRAHGSSARPLASRVRVQERSVHTQESSTRGNQSLVHGLQSVMRGEIDRFRPFAARAEAERPVGAPDSSGIRSLCDPSAARMSPGLRDLHEKTPDHVDLGVDRGPASRLARTLRGAMPRAGPRHPTKKSTWTPVTNRVRKRMGGVKGKRSRRMARRAPLPRTRFSVADGAIDDGQEAEGSCQL
jgi:hypothetical protein